jgi:membrane-bound lytic murein transglycosylase D
MYIYEYHNEHGIKPERALVKQFATDTIMIKKQMSFKQISDLLDVPVAQLQLLNPSYKLNVVPFYQDQSHYLRLPQEKIAVFVSNEDKIYAYTQREMDKRERPFQNTKAIVATDTLNYTQQRITLPKTKYYTVKRGDNLGEIADKYSVTIADIKKWNKLKSNTVARGKSLKIITNVSVVQTVKKQQKTDSLFIKNTSDKQQIAVSEVIISKEEKAKRLIKTDTLSSDVASYYVVQKGDNLSNIAKNHNVTVAEIKEWNHLSNASIQLGMSLQVADKVVNSNVEIASAIKTENVEYIVKKGDNLGNIAKKFGSSVDDLKQWNNLQGNTIAAGNSLIVAKSELEIVKNETPETFNKKESFASTSKSKNTNYLVKKGDSLYSISKKYPGVTISDIKKWNDLRAEDLKPGMKLKING